VLYDNVCIYVSWYDMPIFDKDKTLEELQETNEKKEIELSIAQKQAAIARLKQAGLSPKSFGNRWNEILAWLKAH